MISDHALIRWLERVKGIDMVEFRRACEEECKALVKSGASGGWIGGAWCVVKDGRVITFMPDKPTWSMRAKHGALHDARAQT